MLQIAISRVYKISKSSTLTYSGVPRFFKILLNTFKLISKYRSEWPSCSTLGFQRVSPKDPRPPFLSLTRPMMMTMMMMMMVLVVVLVVIMMFVVVIIFTLKHVIKHQGYSKQIVTASDSKDYVKAKQIYDIVF